MLPLFGQIEVDIQESVCISIFLNFLIKLNVIGYLAYSEQLLPKNIKLALLNLLPRLKDLARCTVLPAGERSI